MAKVQDLFGNGSLLCKPCVSSMLMFDTKYSFTHSHCLVYKVTSSSHYFACGFRTLINPLSPVDGQFDLLGTAERAKRT